MRGHAHARARAHSHAHVHAHVHGGNPERAGLVRLLSKWDHGNSGIIPPALFIAPSARFVLRHLYRHADFPHRRLAFLLAPS